MENSPQTDALDSILERLNQKLDVVKELSQAFEQPINPKPTDEESDKLEADRTEMFGILSDVALDLNITENLLANQNGAVVTISKRILSVHHNFEPEESDLAFVFDQVPDNSWLPKPHVPTEEETEILSVTISEEEIDVEEMVVADEPEADGDLTLLQLSDKAFASDYSKEREKLSKFKEVYFKTGREVQAIVKAYNQYIEDVNNGVIVEEEETVEEESLEEGEVSEETTEAAAVVEDQETDTETAVSEADLEETFEPETEETVVVTDVEETVEAEAEPNVLVVEEEVNIVPEVETTVLVVEEEEQVGSEVETTVLVVEEEEIVPEVETTVVVEEFGGDIPDGE